MDTAMDTMNPSGHSTATGPRGDVRTLLVPPRAISLVEHPCIVKNVDKGIASLGGEFKLSKALRCRQTSKQPSTQPTTGEDSEDADVQGPISVSLRPDDPFAKRLVSRPVTTNNLLLKVTVPKRTGRRRKRGSDGPFLHEDCHSTNPSGTSTSNNVYAKASTVFQSLKDNVDNYQITPLGIIDETHRFRKLPDIQCIASGDKTLREVRDNLLPLRYDQISKFKINTAAGAIPDKHIGPSAEFIQVPVAFNYRYRQNTFIKYMGEHGAEVNIGKRKSRGDGYCIMKMTDETVPIGPKPHLEPEHTLTPYLQAMIVSIRKELKERPIITRHILYNKLGWAKRDRIREAMAYCGYFFETGPWRETLIAWGVDPRADPVYRKYQTVSFLSFIKTGTGRHFRYWDMHVREFAQKSVKELENEHQFDGVKVSKTGNLYQFCDITDPLLRRILDTNDIRTRCAPTFQGWYHVGTWAKATVILKDKMNTILGGEKPDDSVYERVVSWPENWDDKEMYETYKGEVKNKEVHKQKLQEHTMMSTVRAAARNPKYAFEKMEALEATRSGITKGVEPTEGPVEELEVPEDMTEEPDNAGVDEAPGVSSVESSENGDNDETEDDDDSEEGWQNDEDSDSDGPDAITAALKDSASRGPRPFGGLY
ncbi:transcription factor tfiiic complex a box associated subunit sfc1 [Lojkania enalia]|uniref:Transcription factor tfiiic complex a box associated subunit sfc1 n=1 Tax=Lojkania enalia TaxID=147567 RepID=A0A9P4NAB8_9PLEO|nr:transcription factor tfiiic complex a box associated subunit sfc1 [Didymosphaeria enalia]